MPRKGLGEILREADLISEAQLREALGRCRRRSASGWPASSSASTSSPRSSRSPISAASSACPASTSRSRRSTSSLLETCPLELCERHLVLPGEGARAPGCRSRCPTRIDHDARLRDRVQDRRAARAHDRPRRQHQERDRGGAPRPQDGPEDASRPTCRRRAAGRWPLPPRRRGARAGAAAPSERRRSRGRASSMDEIQERAIIESLGGAPAASRRRRPPRAPAVEEVQTILAVDDDESVLRMIEMLLQTQALPRAHRAHRARGAGQGAGLHARPRDPGRHAPGGPRVRDLPAAQDQRALPAHPGDHGVGGAHRLALRGRRQGDATAPTTTSRSRSRPPELLRRVETLLNRAPAGGHARVRGRRAPAAQGRRHRPQAGHAWTRPSPPSSAAWPSTSSTTCCTTTWP